jgi:hypothetical protein
VEALRQSGVAEAEVARAPRERRAEDRAQPVAEAGQR